MTEAPLITPPEPTRVAADVAPLIVEREFAAAAQVESRNEKTLFEELHENVEEAIKLTSMPVEDIIVNLQFFEELDKVVMEGGSIVTAWEKWRIQYYTKIQRKVGEHKGYRAALVQSVTTLVLEKRRGGGSQ